MMALFRSFEYGRDISLLHSALRSAERGFQQENINLNLLSSDRGLCRTSALAISNKIQNAYTTEINLDVDARLHAAVFANVLLSSNVVADTDLEYFESVLDFPRIGWPFFMELVTSCGWRKYFLQVLKALPARIRLTVLEAISDICKTMPYIWSCATSALIWSSCVEPVKGFTTSHDETLSALSKIQVLPLPHVASTTAECLLECCTQSLISLSEKGSLSDSEVADWASSLMNVVLDFLQSIFEPTEFSLFNPESWLINYSDLVKTVAEDFYVVPLCCCRVVNNLSWPDICQLLTRAHSLLFKELTKALMLCCGKGLIQKQKTKHTLCRTHGMCVASLIYLSENELPLKRSMMDDMWHLIRRLQCLLNSFERTNQVCETRSPLLACLKELVEKWVGAEVNCPAEQDEEALSDAETFLRSRVASLSSEFIVWVLSDENRLKNQSCDLPNNQLSLLSHPQLFPRLCQVALCEPANESVKKLVLKTCGVAPPKLQEAMLFYILHSESFSHLSLLKLTDFENRLTEKLNLICDAGLGRNSESTEQVFSDFASLCMESPLEVIGGLVDLAVTDGCTTSVAELLVRLRVVCQYKKCPEVEQDVIGGFLLEAFENLLGTMTSKHHDNYVHLIEELVKCSNIVNCDWLLFRIVHYIELAGANDPHPEGFFPVRVFMAISPKMSKHYVTPMAQMLVQMLDKACLELNGARKEKMLHFLQAYIDLDDSWTTQGADLLCGVGLSCAAVKRLFKKLYPEREAFGTATVLNCSEELVLLDAEQWRIECERIATQFPQSSLCDLLMPYFCLCLAGATSEEWVILSAQLRTALSIDMGPNVSVVVFLQLLLMCLIGCKTCIAVGNWSYLFTCFANTVTNCLSTTVDLSEEHLQDILLVLIFGLSSLPGQCLRQQLLLLVDITQRMKTSALREELVIILQEALLVQYNEDGGVSNLVQMTLRKLDEHHASQAEV